MALALSPRAEAALALRQPELVEPPIRWKRRKLDHHAPTDPSKRAAPKAPRVRMPVDEQRRRKREIDRRHKAQVRARTPSVVSAAVWLGANTELRLAREWRTRAFIARRLLEAAERAGAVARVGDGTWVGRRPE